jgi:stage II sporulation protein D
MRRCLVVLSLAAAAGCAAPHATMPGLPPLPASLKVGTYEGQRLTIQRVAFDEYVQATVLSEVAPASSTVQTVERMLEVQAIISRTYAISHLGRHAKDGYDLCATTHCQVYQPARLRTSRWAGTAGEAVRRTAASVLWFRGAPASALYHADCGGRTSTASDVWGSAGAPYLATVDDDGPASAAHTTWRHVATADAVEGALAADARTRVRRLTGIEVVARDGAGRADRILLRAATPRTVRGADFRDVLSRAMGARTIRSTRFDVRLASGSYTFEGRGFGHGVGLCQAGAMARIAAGARPEAVLARYYPGTRIAMLQRPTRAASDTARQLVNAYTTMFTPNFVLSSR